MSRNDVASFVESVAGDPELQAEWNEIASDAPRLVDLAARRGFTITEDELKEFLAAARSSDSELDDRELESVAGGMSMGFASRSRVFKKAQFYEGWPCKWHSPTLKTVGQKVQKV
jgi:predicted ribosomally synthesized peptide with nif11-like leader